MYILISLLLIKYIHIYKHTHTYIYIYIYIYIYYNNRLYINYKCNANIGKELIQL